jgi:hypothetical protein
MSTANIDSADIKALLSAPGLIREDVMNKIWDISKIPLPFTDMVGSDTAKNEYVEWVLESLAAPDPTNARVDGADAGSSVTSGGTRVGNHHQISDKVVKVSYRADASDTIGKAKELAYRLMRSQQELRRDVEAIALLNQASVQDDGNSTAGKVGGLPTWLASNVSNRTGNGFNTSTKLTVVGTATADGAGITEDAIRDIVQEIFQEGGDPSILMSTPAMIRTISEYMFTSSARIGTMLSDQGKSAEKATAMGSVNVFVTDFGTLKFVPNRLQLSYAAAFATPSLTAAYCDLFILDPQYLSMCYLHGYRTDPLAKTGLAENRQLSVDWSLKVHTEKAHGLITSIDPTTAMTAS